MAHTYIKQKQTYKKRKGKKYMELFSGILPQNCVRTFHTNTTISKYINHKRKSNLKLS